MSLWLCVSLEWNMCLSQQVCLHEQIPCNSSRPELDALHCFAGYTLSLWPLLNHFLSAMLLTAIASAGAGYDTSAVTMTWAMYLIAQHPEVSLAPPSCVVNDFFLICYDAHEHGVACLRRCILCHPELHDGALILQYAVVLSDGLTGCWHWNEGSLLRNRSD